MKKTLQFALTALLVAAAPVASAKNSDPVKVSNAVKAAVTANADQVLNIVASSIQVNESCACEIVKAAIVAADADKAQVAQIVKTAVLAAPSQLRVIAQCAIATAPDATAEVQSVVERFDAAGGDGYSSKGGMTKDGLPDSKGVVDGPPSGSGPNPLDFPFQSLNGPGPIDSNFVNGPTGGFVPRFSFPTIAEDPFAS